MTIQSEDNLIASWSAGRNTRQDWNKIWTGTAAAGRWYELFSFNGYPPPTTFPGTALACVNCSDAAGDGTTRFGLPHGGDVSAMVKHMISSGLWSTSSTGVPATLKLVDLVSYWPGINMASGSLQTLSGTPTLTRWPNGEGLRAALAIRTASGGTAHNLAMSYTNQAGASGKTFPFTVACTASAIVGHLTHSGTAANNHGPELPLASGDSGIQNVASVQLSASSTAGTAVLLLYRVLADINITIQNVKVTVDRKNQIPSMVRIPDGACLGWLLGAGAAVASNSTFAGHEEFIWG
jgi:hypothetical protein